MLNERPCDYYYVTPGHQVPTGVTMSSARRRQLLEHAARHDAVIIEDDYDSESNFTLNPLPALESQRSQRPGGVCQQPVKSAVTGAAVGVYGRRPGPD